MQLIQVIDAARAMVNEPLEATRTFPDDTSSFFQDSTLLKFFNITQQEVANEIVQADEGYFETSTFLDVSAGTARYTLPSGTLRIKRVEDLRAGTRTLPQEIRPVSINARSEYISETVSATVVGGGYYLQGESIVLTETPTFTNATSIRLHYIKKVSDLTDTQGTAISEVPEQYHHILVYGIVHYMLFAQQSENTTALATYRSGLADIRKTVDKRQVQRSRTVKSLYGDADL